MFSEGTYFRRYNENSITKVLKVRNFNRLLTNDRLLELALNANLNDNVKRKIYGFSFIQLKELLLALLLTNNRKLRDAFYKYKKHNMVIGHGSYGTLKTFIQTRNYFLFKLICFLQIKLRG